MGGSLKGKKSPRKCTNWLRIDFFPLCSVNWVKWFDAKIEENRKSTIIDPRNEGVRNVRTLKVDVKTT